MDTLIDCGMTFVSAGSSSGLTRYPKAADNKNICASFKAGVEDSLIAFSQPNAIPVVESSQNSIGARIWMLGPLHLGKCRSARASPVGLALRPVPCEAQRPPARTPTRE